MEVQIWHLLVLTLYITKAFEVCAVTVSSDDEDVDIPQTVTVIRPNTILLVCPTNLGRITWKYLSSIDGTETNIESDSLSSLTFDPKEHKSGVYACVANNSFVIKKVNVTVLEAPYFTRKNQMPRLLVKPAGNMVRLTCRAEGNPKPNITWYRDDKSPPTRKLGNIKISPVSLTLEDLVPNDAGNYTCLVCNIVGCINFTFAVDVVVRSHFGQMAMGNINQFKNFIIANCLDNKSSDIEDDLRETFTELETCIQKRKMYVDTKEDYIKNIEDCSKDPIKKVKRCLTKQQSYYPDFILNGVKKQVELVYDDQDVITTYLSSCMKVFERPDVSYGYLKCVEEASTMPSGSLSLPDTVEAFCSQFLPAARCLADVLDKECAQYPKMKKYSKDYVRATEYPCEQEYY
uniref:Hemicentin-1-like isoform X1 n=1 Tax=Diabrotica virgifera virgifera TaxID=50390 RepID=A0A6P7G0E4_DIAVI